ncbi:M23 family metallopeptidase [Citricoccus sp.]|uniref:M23 family metallopeptidase n=1 Tax=Citricoccus sp. TaxID=1978372 RepID=UPI0028BF102C|nr:M23 family metallopeptidase [Citricoccus sp.]
MTTPLDLEYPFTGRWLVQNSPANRVPSHGTSRFGLSHAIDFVPVDDAGRSAPYTLTSFLRPEPAALFPGFGRPLTAPIEGVVVGVHGDEPDHQAHRGLPSVGYAMTQRRRLAAGWWGLSGNHVLIETRSADGRVAVVVLCHLQQGSPVVRPGQSVRRGEAVGRCGNSGNSTEPHVHVHAVDRRDASGDISRDISQARAVPISFRGSLPRNGEIVDAG